MRQCGIYKIQNMINNKVYIGQSNRISKRIGVHKRFLRQNKHQNIHLQRSFNKYGESNFIFEIVELCDESVLNEREKYWIEYYNSFINGYNQTIGGDGTRGYVMSDETKRKLSMNHADFSGEKNPMYGKHIKDFMSPEEYELFLLRPRNYNHVSKPKNKESIDKQRKSLLAFYKTHVSPMKGKKLSSIQKENLLNGYKKYLSEHGNPHSKKVICLNTLVVYDTIKKAADDYNINASHISSCCQHNINSSGKNINGEKLMWMYYDEYKTKTESEIDLYKSKCTTPNVGKNNPQSISVICVTTNEIFDSISSASQQYNLDASSIVKCCKGKTKYCGIKDNQKLLWKYY